jgi:hypothetical protein
MSILTILGWALLCVSWMPKKSFIKDERTRLKTNLVLSILATGILICSICLTLLKINL